jgi:hypothetical protein
MMKNRFKRIRLCSHWGLNSRSSAWRLFMRKVKEAENLKFMKFSNSVKLRQAKKIFISSYLAISWAILKTPSPLPVDHPSGIWITAVTSWRMYTALAQCKWFAVIDWKLSRDFLDVSSRQKAERSTAVDKRLWCRSMHNQEKKKQMHYVDYHWLGWVGGLSGNFKKRTSPCFATRGNYWDRPTSENPPVVRTLRTHARTNNFECHRHVTSLRLPLQWWSIINYSRFDIRRPSAADHHQVSILVRPLSQQNWMLLK